MINTDDLLNCATKLKEYCSTLDECKNCIFTNSVGSCVLADTYDAPAPQSWRLKECSNDRTDNIN